METNTETGISRQVLVIAGSVLALILIGIGLWWWLGRATVPVSLINPPSGVATSTPTVGKLSLNESGKYYAIHTSYPGSTSLPGTTNAMAVTAMKGFIQNAIGGFKEDGNFENLTAEDVRIQGMGADRKYSLDINFEIYTGSRTVTYVYTISTDTLGAYPNTYYRTFTFDTVTGATIELSDLFIVGAPFLERISKQTRADLPYLISSIDQGGTPAEPDTESINAGTQPQQDSFQNFAIEGGMLLVIFPPYQVVPYSIGTVVDPIPLSTFKSILKAEYK